MYILKKGVFTVVGSVTRRSKKKCLVYYIELPERYSHRSLVSDKQKFSTSVEVHTGLVLNAKILKLATIATCKTDKDRQTLQVVTTLLIGTSLK